MPLIAGLHSCPTGNKIASSKEESEEENAEDVAERRWARARYTPWLDRIASGSFLEGFFLDSSDMSLLLLPGSHSRHAVLNNAVCPCRFEQQKLLDHDMALDLSASAYQSNYCYSRAASQVYLVLLCCKQL